MLYNYYWKQAYKGSITLFTLIWIGGIQMKKIALILLTGFTVLAMLNGCSGDKNDNNEIIDKVSVYEVTLFYANNLYVESGNEELEQMIEVSNIELEAKEGEQYLILVDDYLRSVPSGVLNATTLIDDVIRFNSITVMDGTAIVDIKGEGLSGGSLGEGYVISQIVESLIASFDEINMVQFLIDGQETETLMGHFDITSPYTEGIYKNR